MDKIWVKDVKEGDRVKSLFLVARKAIPTAKSGKTYLSVTLHDKTGELEARAFDRVEELAPVFEEKDYVEAEGQIGTFQGKHQLRIESVSKVDASAIEVADFVYAPPPEPKKPEKAGFSETEETLWKELNGLIETVTDPHVKQLVRAFLEDDDVVSRLRRAPAAKTIHHAYPGGLLEHTVSCLKLAHRIADHFPQIDRDLLVAGAFFHDLGKIRELTFDRQVEYTDEGRLVGHLVMTAQWVHDKARRVGVPRDLEQHVVHLVLAHHGRLDYGSPRVPMTLEALLTHFIDELDSRVNSWLNVMAREGGTRRWTDSNNMYEQHIWRGALPTIQAEKKGPPAELMTPVIYVPRNTAAQPGGELRRQKKKRERGPRPAGAPPRPPQEPPAAEAPSSEGPAAAHRAEEAPAQSERPPRPERRERLGPGERPKRYMGPRLPGDRGPQPRRPEKPGQKSTALTHNPFAALASKLEEPARAEAKPADAEALETPATAEPPQAAPQGATADTGPAPGATPATGESEPAPQ